MAGDRTKIKSTDYSRMIHLLVPLLSLVILNIKIIDPAITHPVYNEEKNDNFDPLDPFWDMTDEEDTTLDIIGLLVTSKTSSFEAGNAMLIQVPLFKQRYNDCKEFFLQNTSQSKELTRCDISTIKKINNIPGQLTLKKLKRIRGLRNTLKTTDKGFSEADLIELETIRFNDLLTKGFIVKDPLKTKARILALFLEDRNTS